MFGNSMELFVVFVLVKKIHERSFCALVAIGGSYGPETLLAFGVLDKAERIYLNEQKAVPKPLATEEMLRLGARNKKQNMGTLLAGSKPIAFET